MGATDPQSFISRIKKLRIEIGLEQRYIVRLGKELGLLCYGSEKPIVTANKISQAELNDRITPETALAYAKILNHIYAKGIENVPPITSPEMLMQMCEEDHRARLNCDPGLEDRDKSKKERKRRLAEVRTKTIAEIREKVLKELLVAAGSQ